MCGDRLDDFVYLTRVSSGDRESVAARYHDGFSECAQEVDRFLASVSGLGHDTRYRLMNHLASCIKQPPTSARRTHGHPPPAFSAPALNPGIYGVQLPASSAAPSTTGRVSSTSESTVQDVDGRRRSLSVAALPYNSAVFPGFVAAPPMSGRLSACSLFPLVAGTDQPSAATSSSFRPIQPPDITADRCSPSDSDELDAEVTAGDALSDVDEDNAHPTGLVSSSATSREVASGRPLTQKNDNTDNIVRGFLDAQKREAPAPDAAAAADQSVMMFMMAMRDDVKDEQVWRPW